MSNSNRAKLRRLKRSHITKSKRSGMSSQHFGDKYVFDGHRIMIGQNKNGLIEARNSNPMNIPDFTKKNFEG